MMALQVSCEGTAFHLDNLLDALSRKIPPSRRVCGPELTDYNVEVGRRKRARPQTHEAMIN